MGRTPGALNKPKNTDEGMDFDNTIIEGVEVKPKKDGRGRPAGGKTTIASETIAEKINILCEGIAGLMGYEYIFTADDYKKESVALTNIAKLYPPVAKVLDFFDPLLIVFGIFHKFKSMKKKPNNNKPKQQTPQNITPVVQEQPQQPGLTLMKMG